MNQGFSSDSLPLNELTAITPLDGRYRDSIKILSSYISEYSLIQTRFEIEAKYLIALSELKVIRKLSIKEKNILLNLKKEITLSVAKVVKEQEKQTRHDVKAVERVMREFLRKTSLKDCIEMIHFGLTSEDINNLSYRLLLFRTTQNVCLPVLEYILASLLEKAEKYKRIPMLARTHGQPAVPTTLGKELVVFAVRLNKQLQLLKKMKLSGKLTGAVGNFNALAFVHPRVDWFSFSKKFVSSLDLLSNAVTTQINPYDDIVEYMQIYQRINNILIDLDQDLWRYISDGWFIQDVKKGEVGSSTMPQKVNPIDFENSEGNLGMANSIIDFFSRKLMISRLQRDLSDSTVIRNGATVLGFCLMGYMSTRTGLGRIRPNEVRIAEDLENDWIILTEGVQTLLRSIKTVDPYSLIASLSRGNHIDADEWDVWIRSLPILSKEKKLLLSLTPQSYIGLAVQITEQAIKNIKKEE